MLLVEVFSLHILILDIIIFNGTIYWTLRQNLKQKFAYVFFADYVWYVSSYNS